MPTPPPSVTMTKAEALVDKYVPRAITRPNAVLAVRAGLANCGHSELGTPEVIDALVHHIMTVSAPIQREDAVPKSEFLLLKQKLAAAELQLSHFLGMGDRK